MMTSKKSYHLFNYPEQKPVKYGRYHVIKKDGKEHTVVWNNTGWAFYNDEIVGWLQPTKWHTQADKPPYDINDKIMNTSIRVCLYSPSLDMYSIGWFDFDLNKWFNFSDEEVGDFEWTYLPKR